MARSCSDATGSSHTCARTLAHCSLALSSELSPHPLVTSSPVVLTPPHAARLCSLTSQSHSPWRILHCFGGPRSDSCIVWRATLSQASNEWVHSFRHAFLQAARPRLCYLGNRWEWSLVECRGEAAEVSRGSKLSSAYSLVNELFVVILKEKSSRSVVEWMSELAIIVLNDLGEDIVHRDHWDCQINGQSEVVNEPHLCAISFFERPGGVMMVSLGVSGHLLRCKDCGCFHL